MIKKLLAALALAFACSTAHAFTAVQYVQISTVTLTRQNGTARVAGIDTSSFTAVASTSTNFNATVSSITTMVGQNLSNSTITITCSSCGIKGVTDASNAFPGNYGEFISSYTQNMAYGTNNQLADMAAIVLTAGDWDISGMAQEVPGANLTEFDIAISSTSGNSQNGLTLGTNYLVNLWTAAAQHHGATIGLYRASITSTMTFYLKVQVNYTGAGTINASIVARRAR